MAEIRTPMDCLNQLRNKLVEVTEKTGNKVVGKLIAFDLSTNLSVSTKDGLKFISGYDVENITEKCD